MTISKSNKTIGMVILHNDLRIYDNATLLKASTVCDSLLIVYPKQKLFLPTQNRGQEFHASQHEKMGKARAWFLLKSLSNLDKSLQQLGNGLLYLDAEKAGVTTFNQIKTLINEFNVGHVFVSNTADYDQNQGYRLLAQNTNTQWYYATTHSIYETRPTETLPKVFTEFRKLVEKSHPCLTAKNDLLISPTPSVLPSMPVMATNYLKSVQLPKISDIDNSDVSELADNQSITTPFIGGEHQALSHLQSYFESNAPQTYKETRNALFLNDDTTTQASWSQTTRFAPWLANGSLSVRVLLNRLRQYEREKVANDSTYWIWFELLWREYFYWYADTHGKKLFRMRGISGKPSRKCFYGERYERWKNGSTPYPIVNACMKQLKATGYMSNRGRQLVASCFIHELGLDWRYGASYFEQQLIDYDVASNWGNWQYLAGVGADPRGSRKFNLDKQTQQYDPEGKFIKKWGGNDDATVLDSVDMVDWYV